MATLVVYASVEGHTKKIAEFVEKCVTQTGQTVRLIDTGGNDLHVDLDNFKRVILAAPVHRLRHPTSFEKFVKSHHQVLSDRLTLFLSVSLCAGFPHGVPEARSYVEDFTRRTGFTPTRELLVGGALQFNKYQEDEAWIVRFITRGLYPGGSVGEDRELTNWDEIEEAVSDFAE